MKNSVQKSNEPRLINAGSRKALQILFVLMAFMMIFTLHGCDELFDLDGTGTGTGTETGAQKAAVKYRINTGGETAITFDNSKSLFRSDVWMSGMHFISIADQKNKTIHSYNPTSGWSTLPYTDTTSSGDYTFKESDAAKLEKLPDRTIAGKVCKAYRTTHKDGSEYITAVWQGLMMYNEDLNTGTIMEATSATLDFPASAFSQESIEVTWL